MRKYIATAFILMLTACASERPAPAPVLAPTPVIPQPACAAPASAPMYVYDIPPSSFDGTAYTFKIPNFTYPYTVCEQPARYAYPGPETVWQDQPQLIPPAAAPIAPDNYVTMREMSVMADSAMTGIAAVDTNNPLYRVGVYTNLPNK